MQPDAVRRGPIDWDSVNVDPASEESSFEVMPTLADSEQMILQQAAQQLEVSSFRQPVNVGDQPLRDMGHTTQQMVNVTEGANVSPSMIRTGKSVGSGLDEIGTEPPTVNSMAPQAIQNANPDQGGQYPKPVKRKSL